MRRTAPIQRCVCTEPHPYHSTHTRNPRILIPSSNHALQSTHADNLDHRDMNQLYQEKQAEYYNRKASQTDRRPLHANKLVCVYNTLTKTWDKGKLWKSPTLTANQERTSSKRMESCTKGQERTPETKTCSSRNIRQKTPSNAYIYVRAKPVPKSKN